MAASIRHRSLQGQPRPFSRRPLRLYARNRLLFEPHELTDTAAGGRLAVGHRLVLKAQDARADHIRNVLKLELKGCVRAGVLGGCRVDAQMDHVTESGDLQLTITGVQPPLPEPRVDLLLALPRPKVLRRLWPVLGELGVGCVMLTGAARVEKTFFAAGSALDPNQVRGGLIKGLEQAGDTRLPDVVLSRTLKGALRHMEQRDRARQQWSHGLRMGADHGSRQGDRGRPTLPELARLNVLGGLTIADGSKMVGNSDPGVMDGGLPVGECGALESLPCRKTRASRQSTTMPGTAFRTAPDVKPGRKDNHDAGLALPWGVSYLVGGWSPSEAADDALDVTLDRDVAVEFDSLHGHVLKLVGHPYADAPLLQVLQQQLGQAIAHATPVESTSKPLLPVLDEQLGYSSRDSFGGPIGPLPGSLHDGVVDPLGSLQSELFECGQSAVSMGVERVLVAVGPEGGWWQEELHLLAAHGFLPVGLGPRVLTTTTALVSMVGCVHNALLMFPGHGAQGEEADG